MSGIYIPGMKMPERCGDCEIGPSAEMDGNVCPFYQLHGEEQAKFINIRHPDCPVIPVPPHGRLIEKDDVFKLIQSMPSVDRLLPVEFMRALYGLPTIIPADKEDK